MIDPDYVGDNTTRAQRVNKWPLIFLLVLLGIGFGAIFFFGLAR